MRLELRRIDSYSFRSFPVASPCWIDATQLKEAGLKRIFSKFLSDESGATAIEYGLIAAGISLAIIAAVNGLGSTLNTNFNSINSSLK
jgi:pilus assembly protein Flp/PilA